MNFKLEPLWRMAVDLKDDQGRSVFVKCVWVVDTSIQDILDIKLKQKVICVHNMDTF